MIKNIKTFVSSNSYKTSRQNSYIIYIFFRASLFFLILVTFLFISCSPKRLSSLEIYFQKIEKLEVRDSVIGYYPKIEEKQVHFLWARAREFNFPYGENGVLHMLEEIRIKTVRYHRKALDEHLPF